MGIAFDPSGTASYEVGLFGVPSRLETSQIVIIPVPWEVTTSYGSGTADGPLAVWKASPQIDLFDRDFGTSYEQGFHLLPVPESIRSANDKLKPLAQKVRKQLEKKGVLDKSSAQALDKVNAGCAEMSEWVYHEAQAILKRGQIPAVLGGDHSSPEGNIRAVSEHYKSDFAILHIDAHADLRQSYQGFVRSHASIMFNVMSAPWKPKTLVQVGIRDFSREEFELSESRPDIETIYDQDIKTQLFDGHSWSQLCQRIVALLPQRVYVSFDIDGLNPEYCPHTGTPVPGGLTFDQALHLLRSVVVAGRTIVGFDLNEVAPFADDEWDANVGARMLYKLCGWTSKSQPAQPNSGIG